MCNRCYFITLYRGRWHCRPKCLTTENDREISYSNTTNTHLYLNDIIVLSDKKDEGIANHDRGF